MTLGRVIRAQWGYPLLQEGVSTVTVSKSTMWIRCPIQGFSSPRFTGEREREREGEWESERERERERGSRKSTTLPFHVSPWNLNNWEGKRYIHDASTLFCRTFEIFVDFLPFYLRRMFLARAHARANRGKSVRGIVRRQTKKRLFFESIKSNEKWSFLGLSFVDTRVGRLDTFS